MLHVPIGMLSKTMDSPGLNDFSTFFEDSRIILYPFISGYSGRMDLVLVLISSIVSLTVPLGSVSLSRAHPTSNNRMSGKIRKSFFDISITPYGNSKFLPRVDDITKGSKPQYVRADIKVLLCLFLHLLFSYISNR